MNEEINVAALAKELGLTTKAVYARIARLAKNGQNVTNETIRAPRKQGRPSKYFD